ncbi:MAG: RnfABCDGE type electron transport complex subunit D [Clostridia bacterium]|nr:RnfABCDGE type electron transport complex subunit D [Clostridia bacterium]MBR3954409.1 RnfABCDGE type electron transport complex subunit D [Clostridia bacterium]
MSALSTVTVSPHIHSGKTTARIMLDVLIALLPATIAGTVIFGWKALAVVAVCVVCCVGFEALFNLASKKEQTVGDLSAAVTGLLLALNLPVDVPLWQCAVGSLFAIILVKCLFGGLGCNLVNPAITARVFMLVAFSSLAVPSFPVDAVASATPLSSETMPSLLDLFLGNHGGAIGETCALALLLGGIYLLVRRVITWHVPVLYIATVFVFSLFMEGFDAVAALSMILSGGLFIGAFFMATDYTTSPYTAWGKVIFAVGAGLLTCLIRYFGTYPEGVSFAILFMNILNPYICKWTKRKVFAAGGEEK